MTPATIAALSLSMSTDAFAAAVGRGAAHAPSFRQAAKAGLVFGVIEGITPLIGWGLGTIAADLVQNVDHWIAFGLLGIVGGHMIWQALKPDDAEEDEAPRGRGPLALVFTAVGTSIDAAAVGVGLAFVGVSIWGIAAAIGCTTFVATTVGMLIGRAVGARFGKAAELAGGVVLILVGTAILLEHLGYLGT